MACEERWPSEAGSSVSERKRTLVLNAQLSLKTFPFWNLRKMFKFLPSAGRSHRGSTARNTKHMAKSLCYGVTGVGPARFSFPANSPLPHSVCLVAEGWST